MKIKLLCHILNQTGTKTDTVKTKDIVEALSPKKLKGLRSFPGPADYYRRFIKSFAESSVVLRATTSVKKYLERTEGMQMAFEDLKNKLTTPPVLVYSDFETPFMVKTDDSSFAFRVVLAQKKGGGKVHPVQFSSHTMTGEERHYSTS